ncbi:MAG TPA: hypothetical protein EYP19_03460, partial [Desulfobacterales bacterium]|nr:hypothetical protein [Desulfobacterales bacterium]
MSVVSSQMSVVSSQMSVASSQMQSVPWQERYADKLKTAQVALRAIRRGDHIFIGSGAASPQLLIEEMARR